MIRISYPMEVPLSIDYREISSFGLELREKKHSTRPHSATKILHFSWRKQFPPPALQRAA